MRGKVILSLLAVACAGAAWLYLSPDALSRARQIIGVNQVASDKPAPDSQDPQAGGKQAAGGTGARSASIISATATTADFPVRRYAIGFVSSPAVVSINARVSSQIVSIDVKDGQMVKTGDLLFSLDDRALKAQLAKDQATLAKDQALLASSNSDLQRAKDLVAKQAGTQQTYDQAVAAQKAAAATVDADKATIDADNVQLGFARITAPISGRLGAVNVAVGDLVTTSNGSSSTSTPLVTITQMDPLQVNFNLPESNLALLHKALAKPQQGAVTLTQDGDPTPIGKGTLDFVDSSVDTASGTIATRASIPNADLSLWPGQYVNVVLDAGIMPQMTSVPTVAVQPSQKGPFVYVVKPDNTVEMRPVQVALTVGQSAAISDGLKSGEKVVIEGQTRLKNGAAVHEGKASAGSGDQAAPKIAQADKAGEAAQ
ncbi:MULTISPECIES: efflux RND transporter periplasmic adaptor subunit [unclassified Mesorhizobium]|uniref:efflux RND transporter periplasmic adaptor subunit n=1 Tax=unclassified Mesorhizobium TaxID=325217 RepID=UPI001126FC06|nr:MULTISPECIES: efflux RND transporter periplasmic adaptor subunit [unclassified Mesorhizobium]TPJ51809.1 efflux RND transporter periplasmic adaptor subunit [Mesorhizobium sp. B2-6-4]TPK67090.1 efflux RND transporter periplasmic adaptor subunit [Mesorhizobium sp. B2-5-1]TPM61687.1 efflux RND transporter periplasmic adaptor subunit [Mesorhizobium sp. B2-1-9]TPM86059.1 efflux RND transporter periplasmic adaptor subunit [Mesorhizobium sp. B2-1-4]TPN00622.1 efflux RND transporter periplasmic adap